MTISQDTHDRITETELVALIETAANCQCPPAFPCYCNRNLEWATAKLEQIQARRKSRTDQ